MRNIFRVGSLNFVSNRWWFTRFLNLNIIVLLFRIFNKFLLNYLSSINLSYLWNFGFLALICLIIQIVSGIFLSMHYVADVTLAFASIEHIIRDVNYGWFIRYIHLNGAPFLKKFKQMKHFCLKLYYFFEYVILRILEITMYLKVWLFDYYYFIKLSIIDNYIKYIFRVIERINLVSKRLYYSFYIPLRQLSLVIGIINCIIMFLIDVVSSYYKNLPKDSQVFTVAYFSMFFIIVILSYFELRVLDFFLYRATYKNKDLRFYN